MQWSLLALSEGEIGPCCFDGGINGDGQSPWVFFSHAPTRESLEFACFTTMIVERIGMLGCLSLS